MSETTPRRDADDAHADDGPPTDALTDEVKADSAESVVTETDDAESVDDADGQSTASAEEPTD
ncbi:hypothetical protein [Microbacterium hatanonis]|uniref:Uncharacterized protein n=1 Tax=Microbacterium hatanonis TaxID=404366 RepID=A0A5C8I574_9MICO|nr:hypothetical protein [Microbacterium hatanonis]TXK13320.1 hypothetical protein FVP77_07895 [Microbacterium hatanonis]